MIALLVAAGAGAHDLGYTDVFARFDRDGTFEVEVWCDPAALPPGFPLGAARFGRDTKGARPEDVAALPGAMATFWPGVVEARFDGVVAALEATVLPDPRPDGTVVVRLDGAIPVGASVFELEGAPGAGPLLVTMLQTGQSGSMVAFVDAGGATDPFGLTVAPRPPSVPATVGRYVVLGVEHIVPKGLDHILFVLALFLLSRETRALMLQVSAFTLAHTVTLGLATLGVVAVPPSIVEPVIAASIALVALENVAHERLARHRPYVVALFGLIHGLGFAGVLAELGLPKGQGLVALLSFNVGVEIGQLLVIATAAALTWRWRDAPWFRRRVVIPASLAIAAVALFWTVERALGG